MKRLAERILHDATLAAITVGSVAVMGYMNLRGDATRSESRLPVRALPPALAPKAPVAVARVQPEWCEITYTFAGKIQPWESYTVGFEVPGRVVALGEHPAGRPLERGDRVEAGQILARLDDRVFRAQRAEAVARLEQAASDLERVRRAREDRLGAVSEAEFQQAVTAEALARAQSEIAAKNLEDAVVRAPVAAAISQRLIKAGESVGPHQPVFELVENDRVLLTIHVPESRIRELEQRQREIDLSRQAVGADGPPEDATFRAYVSLEGADPFGKPWPALQGEVYRIAVTADPRTSLFDVEVALDNREQLLRPGMVATASLVVDRIEGYRLPAESVIYRQNAAHAFTIASESGPMEMMLWELGPATFYRARRAALPRWIDQGDYVLAPRDDVALDWIVVRGQHRLADGQLVRPVGPAAAALARGVDPAAVSSDGAAAAGAAP